jgi:hypothetical protein
MTNPIDDYLDRINAGTTEATPEAFADFVAQAQAKVEAVVEAEGLTEPAPPGTDENKEYITVNIEVVNHSRGTVTNDVVQVATYDLPTRSRFIVTGKSLKTGGPIVVSWQYPEV